MHNGKNLKDKHMNKSIDALKPVLTLALDALEQYEKAGLSTFKTIDAIVSLRETLAHAPTEREQSAQQCNHCNGSGRMVRDTDIGTDQECFVCEGVGFIKPEQPVQQGCMRCNTPKKCALYGCSPLTWPAEQPAVPERKPLTDEELRVIENKINPNMRWRSSDEEGITLYPQEYYELVRAIEAAHGIKGDA